MNAPLAPARSRLVWLVPLAAAAGAVLYSWMSWCAFAEVTWNEVRLAPAFALRHGWPLYAPLGGGPLSTWIYGPLGAAINVPATLASSTAGALQLAGAVNWFTLVAPLAVIFFSATELRRHGWPTRVLGLALGALLLPDLSLTYQVPDHTATALGLLACWTLARSASPGAADVTLAAALGVGALWAKQTEIFLVPAQAAFLLSTGARRACGRFLLWTAVLGGITLALGVAAFGADNLWLNLVTIPARLPWDSVTKKILPRAPQILGSIALPWVLLGLLRRSGRAPAPHTEAGRFLRCTTFAALAVLPIGLSAICKVGGGTNSLHAGAYLFPPLVLAWLTLPVLVPTRALVVVTLALALHTTEFAALPLRPLTQRVAAAEQLARANPGQLWFPQNPLVSFYADGKLYHVEDGLFTRHLAGYGVREQEFRRHLPAQTRGVVYPVTTRDTFALQLLPQFNTSSTFGMWTVHQREGAP